MWEPLRTANAEPPRFPHPPAADLDPPGRPTGRQLRCLPPADRQSPAMPKIYFKLLHSPPPIQPLFSLGCPLSILLQSFHIPGRHIPLAARTAECHSGSASMTHSCRIPFPAIPHTLGSGAKDAPLPLLAKSPAESKVSLLLAPPEHPAFRFHFFRCSNYHLTEMLRIPAPTHYAPPGQLSGTPAEPP